MAKKPQKMYLCAKLHYYNLLKMNNPVTGFSKPSKEEINYQGILLNSFGSYPLLQNYWNSDEKKAKLQ
jgi:hypothetical protein